MHSLLGNVFVFFKWSDVYKSQLSAAVSHTQWWRIIGLTLTSLNLTKHYCSKCKNWSKIEYVINTGSIHVRNCCPGSVTTGMASLEWLFKGLVCEGSGSIPGEPPLFVVSVSNEIYPF